MSGDVSETTRRHLLLTDAVGWQIDLPDRDTGQLRYPVQTRIEPAAQDDHRIKSVGKGLDELLIDVPRAA
ncbi:Uncharacterised protein [Mycobacteroides abscessus subsp. massiliense]|nr:Uncharacterised protein [Mycobacteroides abscessus subsp. massiliense]